MALSGKKILITGGAGFIGTTLAKRLVDDNEIVALDNLHRDALGGTELADHPNFHFHQGDVLDADQLTELARGATHIVHAAAIAGVDTVLESPVRTMRVNLIGTYNALEAALATKDTLERLIEFSTSEVFGTYAFRVDETSATTQGSVGEARWTYAVSKLAGEHMAHAYHQEYGLPTASVRPFNVYGPGQIGGGAIRAFIEAALAGRDLDDPRRRLPDPRVVLRRRHGRGPPARARAPERRRRELQHRQRPLGGDDLRPCPPDQAALRLPGRARLPADPLPRRRAAHPERRQGARRCSASSRRSSSTRASKRRSRGTGRER